MVIRKCRIFTSMALTRGQIGTLFFFVSLTFLSLVSSELCSVFVLNLDDPETYSRRNVNCSHHGVKNDICCSGACCQMEDNQLFRIETVDGIFKVEKSQSNIEDLVEIARKGKTIVFKKVKKLEEFVEAESQYWLTIIIVVPCTAILLIIICVILCCCCCPGCPGARKKSKENSNQANQTAQVVQIPMQYMPNPQQQQQTYPRAYPYPLQHIYPDPLPQGYQPNAQQQVYPNPPQQQAYPNPPQQEAYPNPSQQQAYQRSPQPPIYQGPQQDNLQPERGRMHSVGFQALTPKPPPAEPSDAPSAPLPT